jgi:glycosyltransferase involved in cell wall biosynthesis/GT2 family glycosyltransferase
VTCASQVPTDRTRLDVLICTYNNASMLVNTLESLARQNTPGSFEWRVLVVDNASTDETADVVERFQLSGRIQYIRRVFEPEQGLVRARLRGVRETSGSWIAFIDDDCLLADNWLANAAAFIEAHPACGGFGGVVRLRFERIVPHYVRRYGYSFAEQEHGETQQQREWLVGAGMVLNRAALLRTGWLERQYLSDREGQVLLSGGDMEMVLRIRALGYHLWYTPSCVIQHCIPARRTSTGYLTNINYGLGVSQTWCDLLVWSNSYLGFLKTAIVGIGRSFGRMFRQAVGILLRKRTWTDVRVTFSFAKGRLAGLRQLLSLPSGRRRELQGRARQTTPQTGSAHIALLHWGDLIEDFLTEINVSLEEFRETMTGGWMFGYIGALQIAGIKTTLICVSAQVRQVESWTHRPTGAEICVLPANRQYRWLLRRGINSAVWKNPPARDGNRVRRQVTRLLQDVLPYLATPIGLLRREIKSRGIQAILCQEYEHARFDLSILAGMLSKIPVYATFQGGDTQFSRLERFFRPATLRQSAGLIIGSSREFDRVRSGYGLPEFRIARIFNPLDISMWYPEDRRTARLKLQLPESAFLVIWHGRVDLWRKGLDTLVDGWGHLMNERPGLDGYLVLVGDGSDSEALRCLIEAHAIPRVIWRQEYVLDRNVMRRYLSAGDVYAFTSRHEGFPVAPLEAMACGLPVAATDCVGVRDILNGDSDGGLVIPVNDPHRLAATLATLHDNHELRQTMGRQAREHIEKRFSLKTVGTQLRDFLAVTQSGHSVNASHTQSQGSPHD